MRLLRSLDQKATLCKVANTLQTAGVTDLGIQDAVVVVPVVHHPKLEREDRVVTRAVVKEARVPKEEETNTIEEAHHAAGHTGDATTGAQHGIHTAAHPATSRTVMVTNSRMLRRVTRTTSSGHSVAVPSDTTADSTDQGVLTTHHRENKEVTRMDKPNNRATRSDVRIVHVVVLANPTEKVVIVTSRVINKHRAMVISSRPHQRKLLSKWNQLRTTNHRQPLRPLMARQPHRQYSVLNPAVVAACYSYVRMLLLHSTAVVYLNC